MMFGSSDMNPSGSDRLSLEMAPIMTTASEDQDIASEVELRMLSERYKKRKSGVNNLRTIAMLSAGFILFFVATISVINASHLNPAAASLIAGSIAGACGVGIAFPLDTLKTKSQVLGSAQTGPELDVSTAADGSSSAVLVGDDVSKMNMFQLIGLIYRLEGISGFYGGVKGMMVGQGASLHAFLVHRAFIPNLHSFLMQF